MGNILGLGLCGFLSPVPPALLARPAAGFGSSRATSSSKMRFLALFLTGVTPFVGVHGKPSSKAPTFPDKAYVQVGTDGHLYLDEKRVRYWGFVGWPLARPVEKDDEDFDKKLKKAYADIDLMVDRIHDLGFNLVRNWYAVNDPAYKPGDGSQEDLVAYYLWKLDQKGIKIWNSVVNNVGTVSAADVDIIKDASTAKAWKKAIQQLIKDNDNKPLSLHCGHGSLPGGMRAWDPRLNALTIKRMEKAAKWPNHYKKGLRFCDDPQIVVWELSNEEMWYKGIFNGSWLKMPSFFRNELIVKWHEFLKKKYGADEKLTAAWKFLLPGESLGKGTIMLAPLASPASMRLAVNDANPNAISSLAVAKLEYTRDDFTRARGEDVVAFVTDLWIAYKGAQAKELKTWGKGCGLSPCLWDAANCFQTQASYMFQHSDAVATCAYVQGMAHDSTTRRFPFFSGLDAPPRMCWDVPWMEQSSLKGKPHFVYETQIGNRTKYRTEYPARIAGIGIIQDWDIVCWHIYGHSADSDKKNPFDDRLHIWHDFFGYGNDEVQLSAMKACSEIFKNSLAKPAPNPTTFVFGSRTLYDPRSMDYGKSYGEFGDWMIPTCFRYGLRVQVDPTRKDDEIIGPFTKQGVYEPSPVRPNKQVEYDWNKGHLMFDAPGVASYTGFYGQRKGEPVEFANGAVFRDVSVNNPDGMPYPVGPDEGYVGITLASRDGLPLAKSKDVLLSAMSTSFNTGYKIDVTKSAQGMAQDGPGPLPLHEFYGGWSEPGTAPVIVARVGVTIECKAIDNMKYTFRDWHMREIGKGKVKDGKLVIPSDKPVFVAELTR